MIYLIGSLRNPEVPKLGNALRKLGHEVFDDWHSNGPEADEKWQQYEQARGRSYRDAIYAPIPKHIFNIDKTYIDKADVVVLVLPAGRSGHLEFGYARGCSESSRVQRLPAKKCYILLAEPEPDRYDVMYNFADKVFISQDELLKELQDGK